MSIAPITVDPVRPAAGVTVAPAAATSTSSDNDGDSEGISFKDVLDVINPLQHLPVIGTLYRHLTGDQIKPFPKAAGDLLYGGPLGFVGSIADTLFTKITGKDFGSTVFDTVKEAVAGDDDTKAVASNAAPAAPGDAAAPAADPIDTTATPVASNAPALPAPASVTAAALDTIAVPGQNALLSALAAHGVGSDVAQRTADAYRRAINVTPANDVLPAPTLRASIAE